MDSASEGIPRRKPGETSTGKSEGKASAKGKRRLTNNSKSQSTSSDVELEDEFVGRRSKKPKANRVGRTAGKNYPPEIQRALGRAHMLYVEGNVTEAAKILSDVVVQCSSIPEPYALLALIFNDIGKLREALQFYKLASTRDPKQLGHHREVARIAGILGDNESRLEALKLLTRLQPTNLNAAIERARCLFDLQKPKQALDVYAKAAKRFPRRYDIYLDLAEGAECVSPQQHIFVHQALASCLKHATGSKYLGPDVQDLADAFAMKLRDIKLEHPKPKRLPPRPTGLPSKRVGEVALMTADLLVMKLMESRKRQEPQYEVAIQVVEGVVSWLDSCRNIVNRSDADYEYESGEEELSDEKDGLDSESDIDSDDREGDDIELNGEGESDEEVGQESYDEDEDGEPMDRFTLYPITLLRYGICQLYCGDEGKAAKAFAFLNHEEPDGPHGDMMLQVAKAYAETGHEEESQVLLQQLAHSRHPRHRLASIQLGAAYAAQGKYELASETYAAVLEERPYHAAALAGIAEAAYWRGTTAIPSALQLFNPAVDRATKIWKGDIPEASPCDEEGEVPDSFQMLQLLIQWATLSRIHGSAADFACVALPLVSTALGQWTQRQELDEKLQGGGGTTVRSGSGSGACTRRVVSTTEPCLVESKQVAGGEGQTKRDGPPDEQAGNGKGAWKPSAVPSLLGKMDWEVDLRERVSALAVQLLENIDVVTGVGRRAVFWHLIELVRCLDELRKPSELGKLVAAAKSNGMLRGLEKKDLQIVATKNETEVLSTMRGGSPILGPVRREGLALGQNSSHQHPASDQACSEQYYPPPWRYVEEREESIWRRGGRAWPPSNRPPQASQRRSRSRALIELAEGEDDGDALYTLVRALSRTPGNDAMWNLLQRIATDRGVEAADGGFHGEKVEALITRHREQAHGLLYRGHDAVVWNRSKQALRLYAQAHALRQEEPLPILCLATLIIRMVTVMDTMVELDGVCVLQGLACLHRYADLRSPRAPTTTVGSDTATTTASRLIPAVVLEQEIFYNLGRVYQQVGFTELAIEYYNRALRVEDERGHLLRNWHGGEGVTKETAHNLCALYKRTGATAMALRILHKYLSVG